MTKPKKIADKNPAGNPDTGLDFLDDDQDQSGGTAVATAEKPSKSKAKTKTDTEAKTETGAPATPEFNADGIPMTGKGDVDKRYKFAPGTRPSTVSKGEAPGVTRMANMKALLSDRKLELVREGHDPAGVKSITGAKLKTFFVLVDKETGEEIIAGRGEMIKYAGITPPSKRKVKAEKTEDFEDAFDGGSPEAKADSESKTEPETEAESGELDFLDDDNSN